LRLTLTFPSDVCEFKNGQCPDKVTICWATVESVGRNGNFLKWNYKTYHLQQTMASTLPSILGSIIDSWGINFFKISDCFPEKITWVVKILLDGQSIIFPREVSIRLLLYVMKVHDPALFVQRELIVTNKHTKALKLFSSLSKLQTSAYYSFPLNRIWKQQYYLNVFKKNHDFVNNSIGTFINFYLCAFPNLPFFYYNITFSMKLICYP